MNIFISNNCKNTKKFSSNIFQIKSSLLHLSKTQVLIINKKTNFNNNIPLDQ